MLKQVIAALIIRGAVYRNGFAHAPAQGEQPLYVIHMIMGEQKLLKAAGGPLRHQIRQPGIEQRHRAIEFNYRATGATTMCLVGAGAATGGAIAAKNRHQLRAAGAG